VANTLRLLKLPVEIQEDIRQGKMSFAHGKALLEVEDANHVRRLAQEAIAKGLSVRELETLIKIKRPRSFKLRSPAVKSKDPMSAVLEEELRHTLATKVSVVRQKKRGHITIDFYSQEDLERIVKRITAGGREI
jgi:ParB family transcriptional regulator, chromosome partitioning protein